MSATHDRTFAEVAPQMQQWQRASEIAGERKGEMATRELAGLARQYFSEQSMDINGFMRSARAVLANFGVERFVKGY